MCITVMQYVGSVVADLRQVQKSQRHIKEFQEYLTQTKKHLTQQEVNTLLYSIIIIQAISTPIFVIVAFLLGSKRTTPEEVKTTLKEKLEPFNPFEVRKEIPADKRFNTILENINNYKGDERGQVDVD